MATSAVSRLFQAIEHDELAYVKRHFSYFESSIEAVQNDHTPIERAAELGKLKFVKFLTKKGAILRESSTSGFKKPRQIVSDKLEEEEIFGQIDQVEVYKKIKVWLLAQEWLNYLKTYNPLSDQNKPEVLNIALNAEHPQLFEWLNDHNLFPKDKVPDGKPAIVFAVEQGRFKLVKYLAKSRDQLKKEEGSTRSKAREVTLLKKNNALDQKDKDQVALFVKIENILLANEWMHFLDTAEMNNERAKKGFKAAIDADYKPLFRKLLQSGAIAEEETLAQISENSKIGQLLQYSPSRTLPHRHPTIAEAMRVTPQAIGKYIQDEELSSDEESSDEEDEDFHPYDGPLSTADESRILFRGVHFSPKYFDAEKRREAKKSEEHSKSVYSLASLDLAHKCGQPPEFDKADELVKGYFTLLKLTPDKPEFDTDIKRSPTRKKDGGKAEYPNLFVHFVQAYVTTYGKLFNQKGMQRNFNFYCNHNPLLSTSKSVVSASHFGGGHFITESVQYFPKVRMSTGELKHRRLGYVEVYCLDQPYWDKHAIDINDYIQKKLIGVDHHHKHASEIAIESSIPQRCVLGYRMISLPSMRGPWTENIFKKYGLTQDVYNRKKSELQDKKTQKEALKYLIEKVVAFQAMQLERALKKAIKDAKDVQVVLEMMGRIEI